jgi:hypothetical protein
MSALRHGVVVAEFALAEGTTRDDTCLLEPVPWGGHLSTVAAKGEAGRAIAASSGVGNRE